MLPRLSRSRESSAGASSDGTSAQGGGRSDAKQLKSGAGRKRRRSSLPQGPDKALTIRSEDVLRATLAEYSALPRADEGATGIFLCCYCLRPVENPSLPPTITVWVAQPHATCSPHQTLYHQACRPKGPGESACPYCRVDLAGASAPAGTCPGLLSAHRLFPSRVALGFAVDLDDVRSFELSRLLN